MVMVACYRLYICLWSFLTVWYQKEICQLLISWNSSSGWKFSVWYWKWEAAVKTPCIFATFFFFPITIEHESQIYHILHISSISESLSACSSLQCRWQAPCSSCASCCLLSRWAKATRTRRTRTNLSSATFAILSKIQIVDQKIPRWLRKKDFIEEDAYIFYTRVATKNQCFIHLAICFSWLHRQVF